MVRLRYDQGEMYCSHCRLVFSSLMSLMVSGRCPYCGRALRGDLRRARRALEGAL